MARTRMTRRERENRIARAVAELTSHDADLARAREVGGPFHDRSRKAGFETLVLLVVEQQLSLASAAAIMGRVREAVVPFTPETLLGLGERRLRGLGLSGAKVKYCRALAQAFVDGNLKPARLARLDDEAAVEAKQAADAVCLPPVHEGPTQTLLTKPDHGGEGVVDERMGEGVVDEAVGDTGEIGAELRDGVSADVDAGGFVVGEVGNKEPQGLEAIVRKPKAPAGEEGVAATLGAGSLLKDGDTRARLAGSEGSAEGGVPGTDHYDVRHARFALAVRSKRRFRIRSGSFAMLLEVLCGRSARRGQDFGFHTLSAGAVRHSDAVRFRGDGAEGGAPGRRSRPQPGTETGRMVCLF